MEKSEYPEIETKKINNEEISNLELAKIAMICDYLVLDRFTDISSFQRFEMCFGPLFNKENENFLFEAFTEMCGLKRKYLNFGRLISAYLLWKSKSSKNENFNKFMDILFNKMIKTNNEVIGEPLEGGRVFSTRNAKRCLLEENITLNVLKRSGGSRLRRWWSFQEGDESENQRWLKCLRSPPNAVSSKSRDLRPTST